MRYSRKFEWMLIVLMLMLSFTATDAFGQQPLRVKIIANLECPDSPDIMSRPAQNYRIDIGPYNIRTGDDGQARIDVLPATYRVLVGTRPEETLNYLRFYANDKSFDRTYQKEKDFTSNTGSIDLEFKDDARSPNVLSDYELAINIENCEETLPSPPTISPPTTTPNLEVTFPDQVYHPLAINILVTEDGKPVPNAKLKVHAFNLPDNDRKLAEYFLASSCTNCAEGHTTVGGKKISLLCPAYPLLDLPCPLKEKKLPLEVITDANGEARLEFFLPLGAEEPAVIYPKRNAPLTIPIRVEYWKANSDGMESKLADKSTEMKLSNIAVVEDITYRSPQNYNRQGERMMRSGGPLSDWTGDEGVQEDGARIAGPDRVKLMSTTGGTPAITLKKGDGLSIDDQIIINAGGMVSRVYNPDPLMTYPIGAPGEISVQVRFFDGTVGKVIVNSLVGKHTVKIGESPGASGWLSTGAKVLTFVGKYGTKKGIKKVLPVVGPVLKGKSVVDKIKSLAGYKPVYVILNSAAVIDSDDQGRILVTTREGEATVYTETTGESGFAVPTGKTAVIDETLMPILVDTDLETARDADELLAGLIDPIAASPVFAGPGVPGAVQVGMENDVDRPGNDYSNFDLPSPDPALCKQACDNDSNCKAFTYVRPGFQGTSARCWLKNAVPNPVPGNCCISGVKEEVNVTETQILDHAMASSVDESTNEVITRTNAFSSTDSRAYSWLSLGNARAGTVEWEWYSPDGVLYHTGSVDIPAPSEAYWEAYNVWYYIPIAGSDAANLPGNWRVDVFLDGQKLLTEQFTIGDSGTSGVIPAKPLPGVSGNGIPETLHECEAYGAEICGTWTPEGDHFNANWDTGDTGTVRIERWDAGGVVLTRYETEGISAGLSARYEGQISGNKIENGIVTWTLGEETWSGTWSAEWTEPTTPSISAAPSISATPSTVNPGDTITVTYSGAPGFENDWIAIFKVGDPSTSYEEYYYLREQKSGTLTFTAPTAPGEYEFRMFENFPDGGYNDLARSNTIQVA